VVVVSPDVTGSDPPFSNRKPVHVLSFGTLVPITVEFTPPTMLLSRPIAVSKCHGPSDEVLDALGIVMTED
jgi:hypothetical protein